MLKLIMWIFAMSSHIYFSSKFLKVFVELKNIYVVNLCIRVTIFMRNKETNKN